MRKDGGGQRPVLLKGMRAARLLGKATVATVALLVPEVLCSRCGNRAVRGRTSPLVLAADGLGQGVSSRQSTVLSPQSRAATRREGSGTRAPPPGSRRRPCTDTLADFELLHSLIASFYLRYRPYHSLPRISPHPLHDNKFSPAIDYHVGADNEHVKMHAGEAPRLQAYVVVVRSCEVVIGGREVVHGNATVFGGCVLAVAEGAVRLVVCTVFSHYLFVIFQIE